MSLVFNDTTDKLGLCQEVDSILGTNTTSYPLADKARRANLALSDYVSVALASDDRWQFDDTNFTEYPIGTTDLETGIHDYPLTVDMLKVLKIEAKDASGNWYELKSIDRNDTTIPFAELYEDNGQPIYYDKFANAPFVYPAPNYDSTDGLKVYYQRDASPFTAADTTKKPGIPSVHHKYIALKMAEPYARDKRLENYVSIRNEIQKYEEEIIPEFFAKRNKDERPTMTGRPVDCR